MRGATINKKYYSHPKTGEELPVKCKYCLLWQTAIHGKTLCGDNFTSFLGKTLDEPMSEDKWSCNKYFIPNHIKLDDIFPYGKSNSIPVLYAIKIASRFLPILAKIKDRAIKWEKIHKEKIWSELKFAVKVMFQINADDYIFLRASLTSIINYLIILKQRDQMRIKVGDMMKWVVNNNTIHGMVKKIDKHKRYIQFIVVGKDLKRLDPEYYKRAAQTNTEMTPQKEVEYNFYSFYKLKPELN